MKDKIYRITCVGNLFKSTGDLISLSLSVSNFISKLFRGEDYFSSELRVSLYKKRGYTPVIKGGEESFNNYFIKYGANVEEICLCSSGLVEEFGMIPDVFYIKLLKY